MAIIDSTAQIGDNKVQIYIEGDEKKKQVDPVYGDMRGSGAKKVFDRAEDVFGQGMELVHNCAKRVVEGIEAMSAAVKPSEFQVQLAIKLDTEVGAVVAKSKAGAQLQVTMTWKNPETNP